MSTEKNASEEEYFARLDREERERALVDAGKHKAAEERLAAQALHRQRCGKCGGVMKPRDFRGVEIDVCEDCNAVLLDPGELEQLAGKDESGALRGLASLFGLRK